ncbi:MAG: FAD-binding oxidoreductase, partial [Bacteroidota bacterium]
DLTVGGLCMGVGIETSSHREGFLFETIVAYELITADGNLLHVTKDQHPDLFHALPWSHGTLGFLVAVELEIEPVQSHVKLNYLPFQDLEEFADQFRVLAEADLPVHFLEGLVFSESSAVILVGEYAQPQGSERQRINPINRWYKPWFYSHVQTFLQSGKGYEYIPLRHYFHRHTPSVFFQLKDLIPFANQAWYRYCFAWMGAPKIKLMKYSMTPALRKKAFENRVAQDIIVPAPSFKAGLDLVIAEFEIYPLWICPVKVKDHQPYEGFIGNPPNNIPGKEYGIFIDIGIYGIPARVKKGTWNVIESSRKLEAFNRQHEGFQMLYADIFMNRAEFEQMFEHRLYRQVRKKYQAEQAFPEIYDKVIPEKWLINLDTIASSEAEIPSVVN